MPTFFTKTKRRRKIKHEPFTGEYDAHEKVLEMVDILNEMKKLTG